MARITPLTLGMYVDMSGRNGKNKVRWRSVTQVHNYTLKDVVTLRHRKIVFRAPSVPSNLSESMTMPDGNEKVFGRSEFVSANELPSWIGLLFDGVAGNAIMNAKPNGPGVQVLSQNTETVTSTSEAGKHLRSMEPTDLNVFLSYEFVTATEITDPGVGGDGPAYLLELVQTGFPEDSDVGTFKLESAKGGGKSMKTDPMMRDLGRGGRAPAHIAEIQSNIKVYHW